jgi:hypothetical protein
MQTGFRRLHLVLKLADGAWLVSEQSTGASRDWMESEWMVGELRWYRLSIAEVLEDLAVDRPGLSRVDEIGFTDLMRGMPSPTDRCDHLVILSRRLRDQVIIALRNRPGFQEPEPGIL